MSAFTGEHSSGLVPREAHATGDEGWKKPKTGDEALMSMKVTKVDGSVDENSGLKYTVGDKSLGLLSTAIDKALGSMLKSEEAHLKSSPEYAEGATIDLTLLQKAEKAISDKTATEKAESENVVAESVSVQQVVAEKVMVEKTAEEKVTIAKSTIANVAVEEVAAKTNITHTNTTTVQQDVPRKVETVVEQAKSSLYQASSSNPKRPMQRTPGNLVRSLECLSKCSLTFNPTRKSTQDSSVASTGKWFADEKDDTGLQTAENSKFFGIASSIKSFSNEGKELIIHCSCPGCACEEMMKL